MPNGAKIDKIAPKNDVSAQGGHSPNAQLCAAVAANDLNAVHAALAAGAQPQVCADIIKNAVECAGTDVLVALLNGGGCADQDNHNALRSAVRALNVECVQVLLAHRADASFDNSICLQFASMTQQQVLFDLLYPHSTPYSALRMMQTHKYDPLCRQMLEQRIKAEEAKQQNTMLHSTVAASEMLTPSRPKI